ncbi:hypothetical protein FOZ61_009937 [Perkinsus olseni]|uniref:Uncharacterized protein n=1 Tax=Perkinsus olseni TaxID=32597 RepID=A0A7J6KZR8_PEROL|nr:hypothetical protein FOZ61_009937 [Perkinsus olseni]
MISPQQHQQALASVRLVKSLLGWRAAALTDVRAAIERNFTADSQSGDNIIRCTGIIGLARTLLVINTLESPAHNAAMHQSAYLNNMLNDMLEASKTKDNGERTFKAKLLTSMSPVELHLDDVFTSIQGLSLICRGSDDVLHGQQLLDMLYNRATTLGDDQHLNDNHEKLSSRCLDLVCAISSMVPHVSKEGRMVALNAAKIVFDDPTSDLDALWRLRKACGPLGLGDVVVNIDKAFYSRIAYMARIDHYNNNGNDERDDGGTLISGKEATARRSSSVAAAIEWAAQSREGLEGLPTAVKSAVQDGVKSVLLPNEIARIIHTCLLCASRIGVSTDAAVSLLRGATERMMSIKGSLTRDDIYCMMVGLLKTRHNETEYHRVLLDALQSKGMEMLDSFKPHQLAVVLRVLLHKVNKDDAPQAGQGDDDSIVHAIIGVLGTRGRELDIDSINDIIKDTYTYHGKDRLTQSQRASVTEVLRLIFSISDDNNERAPQIELLYASLDALGANKKGTTALHLLCILADHGLASSSSSSRVLGQEQEIPLAAVLRQYIKDNPPRNMKSSDIARITITITIITAGAGAAEAVEDFMAKPNNILLMTTPQYVQLLAATTVMRSKRYHFNDDDDAKNATVKLASILFDQYSLHGTRDDLSANDIMTIIAACLQHSAELTASRRTFNDPLLAEAIRVLVPVIHDSPARPLIDFLTLLSQKKEALPNTSELNVYSPLSQLSSSILSTLSITTIITPTSNNHMKDITLALKAMARLDWYSTRCITSMIDALMTTRLTSSSMEYVGDLMQSLRVLRVHDTPLLQRVVTWYKWMLRQSYGDTTTTNSSRARPYPPEVRAHLAAFALPVAELGYTSSSLIDIVEGALLQEEGNSHPSDPKLLISFLYILSRQGQEAFTRAPFVQGVKRLASTPEEEALQSLSAADWIKAFQVHLAPAIEGPPHIKRELVHDADIKKFIEDNASFSW